ncbi:hypothetical protein JTB14_029428 [Gonioctena quinquepunctata]|nr:hypothetical protein JTB14_029428 [Gonioctena quinquepunctata]
MNQIQNPVQLLKLDGKNWIVWRFQTSVILKGRGLYEFVNGDNPKPTQAEEVSKWLKENAKAQELLVTRMEQGPLTHLLSCETAKDMWSKLKSIYDKESVVKLHLLQQQFFTMSFGDENMSTYISQLEEIKNKLKQAGEELSEKMVLTKILMSLPEKYKHFRSAWESVPIEKQTLDELTSRLLIEEERVKSYGGATAFAGSSTRKETPKKWGGKIKCFVCQKLGHYGKNCYKRKESPKTGINKCTNCKELGHLVADCWFLKNEKNKTDESSDINAFVGASVKLLSDDWCMDTGASEHMCWDKRLFETLTESQMERKVKIGDGNMLDVAGIGDVILWASNGQQYIKTILSKVLYVPNLKFNLFSVGCALDKGYSMTSDSEKCELLDENGRVRAIAEKNNKLYKMDFVKLEKEIHSRITQSCFVEYTKHEVVNSTDDDIGVSDCHLVQTVENVCSMREMRTLVEAARTLIQGMDKKIWAEAINTATYVLNRTGTSSEKDKSPYEVWYKKSVNLNNFKIFGTRVSVYVPKETRRKWDSRSKGGIFLGYSEEVKGYRIFFPDKNEVECHRDIIFLPERNHKPIENNGSHLIYNDTSEGASLRENESTHGSPVEDQVSSDADVESQHEGESSEEETDKRYNLRKNRHRPVRLNDYETSFLTICEEEEPKPFEEAMHTNEATKWKEAIEAEISALQENDTWVCEEDKTCENEVIEWAMVAKRTEKKVDSRCLQARVSNNKY